MATVCKLLTSLVVLDDQEHVHGSGLGEVLIWAEEPEDLLTTLLLSSQVDIDSRTVVAAHLDVTNTAWKSSDVLRVSQEGYGLEPGREIGSDRTGDNVEQGIIARADAKGRLKRK